MALCGSVFMIGSDQTSAPQKSSNKMNYWLDSTFSEVACIITTNPGDSIDCQL